MILLPDFNRTDSFFVNKGKLDFCLHKLTKIPGLLVIYCHKGVGQVSLDFKEYTLSEYSQMLVMPASMLMTIYESVDFEVTTVYFPPTALIELRSQVEHAFFDFIRQHPHYVHSADKVKRVRLMIDAFEEVYDDKENRFKEQMARNLLLNFFLDMYDKVERLLVKENGYTTSRQEELFGRFIALLHTYCVTEREVRFYADKLFITPRYLSLISRQVAGKSAKDLIDEHIVAEMKALLMNKELSVGEIAEALHFPDQSFFGKFFKRHTGMTPGEFRKK
ncbi:MAG: helix-turn-helix domain-containing protein [Bacteroidales bacterium]